jgi:predicted DNA-binding transcriptional regulator YafY
MTASVQERHDTTELGRAGVLAWAATNHVPVCILYRKSDATGAELRKLTPSSVRENSRGRLYVVGIDHARHAQRTFRLDRIEGVLL